MNNLSVVINYLLETGLAIELGLAINTVKQGREGPEESFFGSPVRD
jgi:hypothetical protein